MDTTVTTKTYAISQLDGFFTQVAWLGQGASANVFLATKASSGRKCVLKICPNQDEQDECTFL
jgi:hypothetical protein